MNCEDGVAGIGAVEADRDNSGVPRLWTADLRRICGETDHPYASGEKIEQTGPG